MTCFLGMLFDTDFTSQKQVEKVVRKVENWVKLLRRVKRLTRKD